MARTKETVESKTARTRLKRNALSYLTDLEDIRKEAKEKGDLRLATEINIKLLEHAIGKPRAHIATDIESATLSIQEMLRIANVLLLDSRQQVQKVERREQLESTKRLEAALATPGD